MKDVIIYPTWILFKTFSPLLPKTHNWHKSKKQFTLASWLDEADDAVVTFGAYLWIGSMIFTYALIWKIIQ